MGSSRRALLLLAVAAAVLAVQANASSTAVRGKLQRVKRSTWSVRILLQHTAGLNKQYCVVQQDNAAGS
jgi:hypothetical protein